MLNLQKLQIEVHANARAKGFYDGVDLTNPHEIESRLALIDSELSEALECVREGDWDLRFEGQKPCGLPSEIADVVIRAVDVMHCLDKVPQESCDVPPGSPARRIYSPMQASAAIKRMHRAAERGTLPQLIIHCYCFAYDCGFDLDAAIELKHAYNQTRPHRHGGKAL